MLAMPIIRMSINLMLILLILVGLLPSAILKIPSETHPSVNDESITTKNPVAPSPPITVEDSDDLRYPESAEFQALPERPLQLVKPDPLEHKKLVLVEENVRHLHYLKGAVAVVAVVGKFHSGKSFLMNQLMGKHEGFGIGPTVRPQTMGIWMWGKPQIVNTPNGQTISIIYLDTEGFAASNISEVYDAKIFAVATILSSYLIYNSVKIIDQGDIDYLDLLSRRTRLFALKSQITKSKWFDEFNHDLLKFPPLIWVVQDFVQSTDEGETPQEWLHRIMGSMSRDSEDHNINLLDMFESVNCHTLFLPATKKVLLQDLSNAKENDLTDEYKEERDHLLKQINDNLEPKEKNGQPITGPEIASLLSVLVDAANEGSLAEVPSRWDAFIEQLHVSSVDDCILFYESEMNTILRKYNQGAINTTELEMFNHESYNKSRDLLEKLLLGLQNATLRAQDKLKKSTKERFEKIKDINEKKIELRCGEAQRRTELKIEEATKEILYPLKGSQLQSLLGEIKNKYVRHYRNEINFLSDHPSFTRHLEQLEFGIDRIFNGVYLENKEAMEGILSTAIDKAMEVYRIETKNSNQIPRTTNVLKKIMTDAEKVSRKVFNKESLAAHEEDLHDVFLGKYKSNVQEESRTVELDNLQLIKRNCQVKANELIVVFRQNTDPKKLSFPLNETYLNERLRMEKENLIRTFTETQTAFKDTSAYIGVRKELMEQVKQVCEERKDQNFQAYTKEVEIPLKRAKQLIKLSADKYDTVYSFQQYMEDVCLIHLDDGKAQDWSLTLKMSIITRYIRDQDELQQLLDSKKGMWSTIMGFFQYLYNIIFG